MTAYRVTARRSGDWWALDVPDLPGVHTQAKRLETAPLAAREAISLMLDIDENDISVEIEPEIPADVRTALRVAERARQARREAEAAERRAMQKAAAALTQNLSQRDAGTLLGLSFQRISQLLKQDDSAPADRSTRAKGREAGRGAGKRQKTAA